MPYFPASQRFALPYRAVEMRRRRELLSAAAVTSDIPGIRTVDCFGTQGGDPGRAVDIDLSTCVNRYGPAPAAIEALHSIDRDQVLLHPYAAAERLIETYRWATGVNHGGMLAGRGASEFIWAMGREVDHAGVRLPLPAYTDYLKAFPGRGFSLAGEQFPSVEQVNSALDGADLVVISNPHNPTGTLLDPAELIAAAEAHPASVLVVDESYVDFTPDPLAWSLLGCDVPNIVVLQSTSKFYGIAAMRAGVAWCADDEKLKHLFGQQENWGLSGVDVHAACAAVRDFHWAAHSRSWLHADSSWLADLLCGTAGIDAHCNSVVHFQYAFCQRSDDAAAVFQSHGIGVRVLSIAHGVTPDALRIAAPRAQEQNRFRAAIDEVAEVLKAG